LNFIHDSAPSDLKKIGISPSLAVDLVNNKPYPDWDKLISVQGFTQGIVNLFINYFFDGDLDSKKLDMVVDFINKAFYKDWKKLPLKTGVSNRIFYKRPFESLKELLNVSGVDLELVYEMYDMIISPKLEKPVDLNKASPEELKALKGVSEKSAARIIARRPIQHLNQLIPDFGLAFTRKIEDQVKQEFLPLIDLNKDSVETISQLPQISNAIAKLIVKNKPYEHLDDILDIDHDDINRSFLNKIEDFVTLFFRPKNKKLSLDLNKALLVSLQALPDVTFSIAQLIIENRPIQYLDDLKDVIDISILKGFKNKVTQIFKKDEKDEDDDEEEEEIIIPIDLKKSSIEQIKKIPGISEKVATIIFSYKSINPQYTLDDFFYIKEVGYSRTVKMDPYVTQNFPTKVDFNGLSLAELKELRPIKERSEKTQKDLAKLIDDYRLEVGYFEYLDHITNVKYVTKSLVKLLQHYVTLPLLEKEKTPKLNVYYNLNNGSAKELTENIPWLSLKEARYIVSKRPIKFLDDLLGGPFSQKKLEKLADFVNNKFSDEEDKPFDGTVDLNNSTLEDLLQLPSINIKRAKDIISRRTIDALEDLLDEVNDEKPLFTPEILSTILPFVTPKYTSPNVSDALLRLLNFEFDWLLREAPIPDDLLEEILDIRELFEITRHNIMSIFGMSLQIIGDIEEYLEEKSDDGLVNLNKDEKDILLEIKGMESDIADGIISYRPFITLDEIEFIPGITRTILESWEESVLPKFEYKYDLNLSSEKDLRNTSLENK
jgi:DNA uptake protein and related DNA-binding proteins